MTLRVTVSILWLALSRKNVAACVRWKATVQPSRAFIGRGEQRYTAEIIVSGLPCALTLRRLFHNRSLRIGKVCRNPALWKVCHVHVDAAFLAVYIAATHIHTRALFGGAYTKIGTCYGEDQRCSRSREWRTKLLKLLNHIFKKSKKIKIVFFIIYENKTKIV